jgi:hypothetical protein
MRYQRMRSFICVANSGKLGVGRWKKVIQSENPFFMLPSSNFLSFFANCRLRTKQLFNSFFYKPHSIASQLSEHSSDTK